MTDIHPKRSCQSIWMSIQIIRSILDEYIQHSYSIENVNKCWYMRQNLRSGGTEMADHFEGTILINLVCNWFVRSLVYKYLVAIWIWLVCIATIKYTDEMNAWYLQLSVIYMIHFSSSTILKLSLFIVSLRC